ncbi:UNVERIFIED_CONTAM: hypothetical protein Slati_1882300 [Sesamum latifolium]|uniref:Uncharacterized protein n=1 Tax=Sesamum latifolium TaxID=2727402 RepID=A0AAW2X009_9LAMI
MPTNSIFHVQGVPFKKQKVVEVPSNAQALQIAEGTSLALASRAAPSSVAMVPGPPRPVDPLTESPHYSTSSGGSPQDFYTPYNRLSPRPYRSKWRYYSQPTQ